MWLYLQIVFWNASRCFTHLRTRRPTTFYIWENQPLPFYKCKYELYEPLLHYFKETLSDDRLINDNLYTYCFVLPTLYKTICPWGNNSNFSISDFSVRSTAKNYLLQLLTTLRESTPTNVGYGAINTIVKKPSRRSWLWPLVIPMLYWYYFLRLSWCNTGLPICVMTWLSYTLYL